MSKTVGWRTPESSSRTDLSTASVDVRRKLVVGITSPGSTPLIRGQLDWFRKQGYDVYLACPSDESVTAFCQKEGVRHLPVQMARDIRPWRDLASLLDIYQTFRRIKPDIVNVGTPKMGVLGSLAGFMSRVPNRIYTCRGFRYEHETGFRKRLLMWMEWLAGRCAMRVVCISDSVRKKGIEDRIFKAGKTRLIPPGSSNGVDVSRFSQSNVDTVFAQEMREDLGLDGKFVIGFVGRIIDRKGIRELYEAFCQIREERSDVKLVLVGSKFDDQLSTPWLLDAIDSDPDIHWIGFQEDVVSCLSLFDLFVLPAWWEGFGNVLVQAAAMGLPVLSTDVTGCKDAVSHGYNGTLIQRGNVDQLASEIIRYVQSPALRRQHGQNGADWARRFEPVKIWAGLERVYLETSRGIRKKPVAEGYSGKPKILFVATSDIHLHVFHRPHIEWLHKQGYGIDVAAETRRGYEFCSIAEWHELKFARELTSLSHISTLRRLRRVIRLGNYDLVCCHTPIPGALARLGVTGLSGKIKPRVIYMAHGFHFMRNGSLWNWLAYYPAEVMLSRQTDAIIVINQEDLEHVRGGRFHCQAHLVPGVGVDMRRFKPVAGSVKTRLREELGFSGNEFILMYIGEFIPRKNHQFIIECSEKLVQLIPELRIVFVGRGRLASKLQREVDRRGLSAVVRFTGFREDVERFAAIADLGISSSRREGLGLGLAEQMACGLPAVASVDKGHRELVEHGVNGFLFPQGDYDAFIWAVRELYEKPEVRQRMGQASLQKASNFSVDASIEAMAEVYRSYLDRTADSESTKASVEAKH